MSTPVTELSCLEVGKYACPFMLNVPSTGSTATSLTLSARWSKVVAFNMVAGKLITSISLLTKTLCIILDISSWNLLDRSSILTLEKYIY